MFDTNIFNYILDHVGDFVQVKGRAEFLATHVQMDELTATSDIDRRNKLLRVFKNVTSMTPPTESFVLGVSALGQAKLGGSKPAVPYSSPNVNDLTRAWRQEDDLFSPIRDRLDAINGGKRNNTHDALIAETSIKSGCVLVTHDRDLYRVTTEYGGACSNIHAVILGITDSNLSVAQCVQFGDPPEEVL